MDKHLIAYFIGIFIVFASHIYILYKPDQQLISMKTHTYGNILAALLIAYYFMNKENYIDF